MSPPPLQQQRTRPLSAQALVPPQQHPKPSSLSYKPTQPQPRTVPAPVFAPPPPTSRNSKLASPPPSAGNNYQFPRGPADQEAKRSDGDTFAAANAAVIASVPSPPVTPPGTAPATAQAQLQSQPQSVQSSIRSKYAPQSATAVQMQDRGVAPPPPPPIFSTPVGQGSHARTPSLTQARAETETRVSSPRERETMIKSALSVPPPMPHAALQYSPSSQRLSSLAQRVVKSPAPAFVEPDYIVPDDGQELDPLQRWKGAPVFKFGFGGTISSTFPRQVPKYMAGHALPKMKPMPGEIRVEKVEEMVASAGIYIETAGFPGPLASKSKKKDVVTWMSGVISRMEEKGDDAEDVLLWKIVRLMVENDGVLNGTSAILDAVCAIISPGEIQTAQEDDGTSAIQAVPEVTKSDALARIRNHLMAGVRENAVWEAADNKLWGHALLLSSSLEDKSVWKRVIEEFVQRELSSLPQAQPLAALYEVLAGNPVDSVDQLVPPSARAGLQMMNKTGYARTSALDGLDQWRETVILILRNISPDGPQALIEISQLLASFGRTAASHICALFAKCLGGAASFSGPDDPQSIVTLLGWDHRRQSGAVANNLSSILLTEVYEFATSILNAQSAPTTLPYLQAFKLLHAERLAELGDISRALEYCDGFASTLKKSGHRPSPYYHRMLVSRYEDLHSRLTRLSPDGVAGWMSKPSMTKVSGSVWAKFQNFIAGENEDDVDSSSLMVKEEIGILSSPAQHVMSSQSLTPQQLPQQVHGSPAPIPFPMQSSPSRYTPQARHTPSNSREVSLPQRFASSANLTQYTPGANDLATVSNPMRKESSLSQFQLQTGRASLDSNTTSASRSTSRYIPAAASENRYTPTAAIRQTTSQVDVQCYPTAVPGLPSGVTTQDGPPYGAVTPSSIGDVEAASSKSQNLKSSYDSSSLDPPLPTVAADGESVAYSNEISQQDEYVGYVPPTSDLAGPSPSTSTSEYDEEGTPKTKAKRRSSILDDDEDDKELLKRAAALKKAEERRKDKEMAEKAKKGSEGGTQQSSAPQKKGWFSGWFGGKKESTPPATVVRAKLGEENSFYYDKDLKRWVNKKDPNGAAAATGTLPPPPKAPAPAAARHDSGNGDSLSPPTMPAPAGPPPMSVPGPGLTGAGAPPKMAGIRPPAISAPPTRTDMPLTSNAVSTGTEAASTPPVPRNISDANSLDDLLGAPAPMPRTHTSAKSKRKGRGYVDLMAK
ncbi:vesicle coat component [Ascosphaera pollenicola]|nr:vesicle coat component [Ascosphaera pollenicola]